MLETAEEEKLHPAPSARERGSRSPVPEEKRAGSGTNPPDLSLYSAERVLLEGECEEEYESCRQALRDHLEPRTPLEARLVDQIASLMWRLERIPFFECRLLEDAEDLQSALAGPSMASLIRHFASLDRSLDRALRRLQDLRRMGTHRDPARTPVQDALRARNAPMALTPFRERLQSENNGTNPAVAVAPASRPCPERESCGTNPAKTHQEENDGTNPEPILSRKERRALQRAKRTPHRTHGSP